MDGEGPGVGQESPGLSCCLCPILAKCMKWEGGEHNFRSPLAQMPFSQALGVVDDLGGPPLPGPQTIQERKPDPHMEDLPSLPLCPKTLLDSAFLWRKIGVQVFVHTFACMHACVCWDDPLAFFFFLLLKKPDPCEWHRTCLGLRTW